MSPKISFNLMTIREWEAKIFQKYFKNKTTSEEPVKRYFDKETCYRIGFQNMHHNSVNLVNVIKYYEFLQECYTCAIRIPNWNKNKHWRHKP